MSGRRLLLQGVPKNGRFALASHTDGSQEDATVLIPKGDPGNSFSWEETELKFLKLIKSAGGIDHAEDIIRLVRGLEDTDGKALMREREQRDELTVPLSHYQNFATL